MLFLFLAHMQRLWTIFPTLVKEADEPCEANLTIEFKVLLKSVDTIPLYMYLCGKIVHIFYLSADVPNFVRFGNEPRIKTGV